MTSDDRIADPQPAAPSLAEFLRNRKVKIAALAKGWKDPVPPLSAEELAEAKAAAVESPRAALRVAALIRAARRAPPAIQAAANALGLSIVRAAGGRLEHWRDDGAASPTDDLEAVAEWASRVRKGADKAAKARAGATLAVAVALLGDHSRLEPLRAVVAVGEALGVAPPDNATDQRPARRLSALLAKSNPAQIATLARVAVVQDALLARARADADHELFRARDLLSERDAARATITELNAERDSLRVTLAAVERANEELARRLENAERRGAHALDDLKARYRRVFDTQMAPVAADAKGALEITPPRPEFAVDFLANLISTISKERAWLDEPSE